MNVKKEDFVLRQKNGNYKYSDNILRNISSTNKNYVQKQLDKLDENYLDYIGYWNDKYYKYGFKDAVNLILFGLAGD